MATALEDFAPDLAEYKALQAKIPSLDGYKATKLELRFSGAAALARTDADDLELLAGARLGKPMRLIVLAEGSGKGFRLSRKANDDELGFVLTLKVLSVEAAEIA